MQIRESLKHTLKLQNGAPAHSQIVVQRWKLAESAAMTTGLEHHTPGVLLINAQRE